QRGSCTLPGRRRPENGHLLIGEREAQTVDGGGADAQREVALVAQERRRARDDGDRAGELRHREERGGAVGVEDLGLAGGGGGEVGDELDVGGRRAGARVVLEELIVAVAQALPFEVAQRRARGAGGGGEVDEAREQRRVG